MFRSSLVGLAMVISAVGAQAAAEVRFDPSFDSVTVGDVFDVVLKGQSFNLTNGGSAIGNITGGQQLNLSYSFGILEVLSVTIDPRWTFAAGNRAGTINQSQGTVTGVAFGSFPATTDDDFNIAKLSLRALAPGQGTLTLVSGQFIGVVGGLAGRSIAPSLGQATFTVEPVLSPIPEPAQWALLLLGLGVVTRKLRSRQ